MKKKNVKFTLSTKHSSTHIIILKIAEFLPKRSLHSFSGIAIDDIKKLKEFEKRYLPTSQLTHSLSRTVALPFPRTCIMCNVYYLSTFYIPCYFEEGDCYFQVELAIHCNIKLPPIDTVIDLTKNMSIKYAQVN